MSPSTPAPIKQLNELRKEIKPLGYKVKTETLSWGRHLTYIHIESGENLTFNVATNEQIRRWKPLHDYLVSIPENTMLEWCGEKVIGKKFSGERLDN